MASTPIGVGLAMGASALTTAGIILQAVEARARPASRTHLGILGPLLRRPRWLLGTGLTALAWPLQFVALLFAPLSVVQPTMAVGLVLVVFGGARLLHERLRVVDVAAACVLLAGIAIVGVAAPNQVMAQRIGRAGVAALVAAAALSLAPQAVPRLRGHGTWSALGAGLAYAWNAMASDLLAQSATGHHWLGAIGWAVGVLGAALWATASEMVALRVRPAGQVAPLLVAVETIVPVLLAPVVAHESWRDTPLGGGVLVVGALVVVVAGTQLARAPVARDLMTDHTEPTTARKGG
jgi:drug/metabolite transporter (DMT)-like permease